MKKLIYLAIFPLFVFANSIFVDEPSDSSASNDTSMFESTNNEIINLDVVQKSFLKNKNKSSILNINYEQNKTYRVQTRLLMNTMIVFDNDKIAGLPYFGNSGFKVDKLGSAKYDFSNILVVQPKFAGIDTNLTVIGESGNIYSFYLYSTDHEAKTIPNTVVFVSEKRKQIDKIEVINLEKKDFEETVSKIDEKQKVATEELEYFYIGEGKNRIKVYKNEIIDDFVQEGDESLKAKKIFRDNKFVYFQYDKDFSLSAFPTIFKVVNGYDSPANFRVVGDYLVAETIANKFTLKIEEKYVCVRRLEDLK